MKKYLVFILVLLFSFSGVLPVGAETLSREKKILIDRFDLTLADLDNQINQTASGSLAFKVHHLEAGFLTKPQDQQMAKRINGAEIQLDYRMNVPANKMSFSYTLTVEGKEYRGNFYLDDTKVIIPRETFQSLQELVPTLELPETLPQYLYYDIKDPEMAQLWSFNQSQQRSLAMITELKGLYGFFVEAIPDQYIRSRNGEITLELNQEALEKTIHALLQKIKKDPETFAGVMAKVALSADPSKTEAEYKAEMLKGLETLSYPTPDEIGLFFNITGIQLESLVINVPENADGLSSTQLRLRLNAQPGGPAGLLTLQNERNRKDDRVQGTIDLGLQFEISDKTADFNLKNFYDYSKTATESTASMNLKVKDGQEASDLSLGVRSKAKAEPDIKVEIPVLTPENSADMDALKPQEIQEQKMSITGIFDREKSVRVALNGRTLYFDVQPFIKDKRTMVPVRNLAEALGCKVTAMGGDEVHIVKDNRYIIMYIGKEHYTVNGRSKTLDAPPLLRDGRTLVPIRFVAEELGCSIELVGEEVRITTN